VAVGVDVNTVPVEGQDGTVNSTPLALQAISSSHSVTLHWQSATPLRSDSVYEIAYTAQAGGAYQRLTTTANGKMQSYTLYDLPRAEYHFAVRAITRDGNHAELWSGYSNAVQVFVESSASQIFLPLVSN
jgi:predicted phage tail protein